MIDALGRPLVADADLQRIRAAFSAVPAGKRGALLVIADATGVRGHIAAQIDGHWKVAAGLGFALGAARPSGYLALEATW